MKNALFEETNFPSSCKDACNCTDHVFNQSQVYIDIQSKNFDSHVCKLGAIEQALYFSAVGYDCEKTFLQAQKHIVKLCGFRNGKPCLNETTNPCEWFQIDKPVPFCERKKGIDDDKMYIIGAYIFFSATLWSWTLGVDLSSKYVPASSKLKSRFRTNKDEFMFFF